MITHIDDTDDPDDPDDNDKQLFFFKLNIKPSRKSKYLSYKKRHMQDASQEKKFVNLLLPVLSK